MKQKIMTLYSAVSLLLIICTVSISKTGFFLFLGWALLWYVLSTVLIYPGEIRRIPSLITLSRFILAGTGALLGSTVFSDRSLIPLVFFAAAGLTDIIDGRIARKAGPTEGGAFFDAETDAVFFVCISMYLYITGFAPSGALLCGAFRYLFYLIFLTSEEPEESSPAFSRFAKTACALSAVLLITATAPFWQNRIFFWAAAVVLLAASFIWELLLRLKSSSETLGVGVNKIGLVLGALSIIIFSTGLQAFRWAPQFNWPAIFIPGPEAAAAVLAVVVLSAAGKRTMLFSALVGSVLIGALLFYSLVEAFMRHTFYQPFIPRSDIAYLAPLLEMIFQREIYSGLLGVGIAAVLLLFAVLAFLLIRGIRSFTLKVPRIAPFLPVVMLAAALLAPGDAPLYARIAKQLRPPETSETFIQSAAVPQGGIVPQGPAEDSQPRNETAATYVLPGMQDADIILLVVESYGNTIFTNPDHFSRMEKRYRELESSLRPAGLHAVSSLIRSPIAGGRSWLADATLLSGISLENQVLFDALMKQRPYTLVHFLRERGYETVFAAPGTTYLFDDWVEVFPFEQFIIREDFAYKGPFLSMGALPDQYLLEFVHRFLARRKVSRPVFMEVLLSSSHTPFDIVPPYVEDWSSLGDGSIYHELESTYYDNGWLYGNEYPEGYTDSIKYVLKSIFAFAEQYLQPGQILIVLGDHQPRYPVLEKGGGWEVPIHIILRQRELLAPWMKEGFSPGLIPDQSAPRFGMEHFFRLVQTVALGREMDFQSGDPLKHDEPVAEDPFQ